MVLDITLAVVSCLMAIFGVYVTFWPPPEPYRKKFLLGFIFLTVVSVGVIGVQARNRSKEQAKQDKIQSELRAQNVELTVNIDRLLSPIKEMSVSFRVDVPLTHPELAGYRARLERCIERIVATQRPQCGATSPIGTAYSAEFEQVCVTPDDELYPKLESELLAHSVLTNARIAFSVFKTFSKASFVNGQLNPDLRFVAGETFDSPERKKTPRVRLCFEIKTKTVFMMGSNVPVRPEQWHSNGKVVAIPDLKRATFIIYPMTFLGILKQDERGTGLQLIPESVTAMRISETTTLRKLTLHFSNSEDIEMSPPKLTTINIKRDEFESRYYLYDPQSNLEQKAADK